MATIVKRLRNESGAALLMAILFSMITNGIALTLFATSSGESYSSQSQVVAADTFNVADAAVNIGMLRIKALMEANNDSLDTDSPFSTPPFNLAVEGYETEDTLTIDQYGYFDLVTMAPLDDTAKSKIVADCIDIPTETYTHSIDSFFKPQTSNPARFNAFQAGAEPVYTAIIDAGDSALLRGWRIYLRNDNDGQSKTAMLVAVGYILDPLNNLMYQKKLELRIIIHGKSDDKSPDPRGQVTSSETGARTGKFRVTSDLTQPVSSYDLR